MLDTDPAEVQRVMATHALGAHRLAQLVLPDMRARGRGDIVVISSSEVTHMRANGAPYNMAKAAAEALALTLAHEEAANGDPGEHRRAGPRRHRHGRPAGAGEARASERHRA